MGWLKNNPSGTFTAVGWALPTIVPVLIRLLWWAEPTLQKHTGMTVFGIKATKGLNIDQYFALVKK